MMKKGFTLAEVLITLGIIGVISAILAPSIGNIMPDKNKAKVLKIYNTISRINQEMLETPGIFMNDYEVNGLPALGLADERAAINPKYSSGYVGAWKYGMILYDNLEHDGNITKKSSGVSFDTVDGVHWDINRTMANTATNACVKIDITVDVDPKSTNNCYYGQSGCKSPDIFKFTVDTLGGVEGADPLTKAYLLNPYKMNDKKTDFKKAAELKKN